MASRAPPSAHRWSRVIRSLQRSTLASMERALRSIGRACGGCGFGAAAVRARLPLAFCWLGAATVRELSVLPPGGSRGPAETTEGAGGAAAPLVPFSSFLISDLCILTSGDGSATLGLLSGGDPALGLLV